MRRPPAWLFLLLSLMSVRAAAQPVVLTDPEVTAAVPREQEATLTYANRPIIVLRARLMARMPADRAESARHVLDQLVERGITGPIETRPVSNALVLSVGGQPVFAILPADIDTLSGETLESIATLASAQLRTALAEAVEVRSVRTLLKGVLLAVTVTILLGLLLGLLLRVGRFAGRRLTRVAEQRVGSLWHGQLLRLTHMPRMVAFVVNVLVSVLAGVLVYMWLTFVLRQFPYTRPWGESLRATLLAALSDAAVSIASALPGLVAVAVIALIARGVNKAIGLVFEAVAQGRMALPGVYRDTAVATRRLVTTTVWLLAAAMAYPHIPGSESAAFKGLSVFVGLVISLGSSGIMQHLMSGLMLTFSRAVHVGEFARIGDVTGTVVQIGALATKLRTAYGEEVTIPNAVVVSQTTTNYSQPTGAQVPFLTTSVTIGYDTPWRQVEGLLLSAARQTPGVRQTPAPFVWREGLEDFYVKYTLLVAPEDPCHRAMLLDRLHVRILDAFNEYGVQIMSPHYVTDPHDMKVVPPSRWHAAPAPSGPEPAVAAVSDAPRHS